MADEQTKTTAATATKKRIARCDKGCMYVASARDAQRCKNKCSREVGHILNCKCRTHDMQ